jgi:hypothetical protein
MCSTGGSTPSPWWSADSAWFRSAGGGTLGINIGFVAGIGQAGTTARRLEGRAATGSAFDSASTGTGAVCLAGTSAMTSTGMAFEGALVGAGGVLVDSGGDNTGGEASVGPTMM